jgi:hypothetical protein
VQKS